MLRTFRRSFSTISHLNIRKPSPIFGNKPRWFCSKKSSQSITSNPPRADRAVGGSKSGQQMLPVTWASFGLASLFGVGIVAYYLSEKEKRQNQVMSKIRTVGRPSLGGPFKLFDAKGRPVSNESLQANGEWLLIYFGFTYCPDICPSELVKIGSALDRLDKKDSVGPIIRPVFISVDPKRDSVAQLANYAQDYHPRFEFLTGTPDQLARAARFFRVYFSDTTDLDDDDNDYLVDHSIVMYLIRPDGQFCEFFTQLANVDEVVGRIESSVAEFEAERKQEKKRETFNKNQDD